MQNCFETSVFVVPVCVCLEADVPWFSARHEIGKLWLSVSQRNQDVHKIFYPQHLGHQPHSEGRGQMLGSFGGNSLEESSKPPFSTPPSMGGSRNPNLADRQFCGRLDFAWSDVRSMSAQLEADKRNVQRPACQLLLPRWRPYIDSFSQSGLSSRNLMSSLTVNETAALASNAQQNLQYFDIVGAWLSLD